MKSNVRTLIAAVLLASPVAAFGTLIDSSTWGGCIGAGACSIGNAQLTADPSGRTFTSKTVAGQTGLGISGGRTNGEIDLDETFNVSYGSAENISGIRIVFIFNGPEFNDVAEIAKVTVNGTDEFFLEVSGSADDTASWSFGGAAVSSCGSTTSGGSGCFDIANPFGSASVTSLALTAIAGGAPLSGAGTNESDFSIGYIRGVQVPEPGTLILLGTGLIGLGFARRRRA